jgi:hypothetical protein
MELRKLCTVPALREVHARAIVAMWILPDVQANPQGPRGLSRGQGLSGVRSCTRACRDAAGICRIARPDPKK